MDGMWKYSSLLVSMLDIGFSGQVQAKVIELHSWARYFTSRVITFIPDKNSVNKKGILSKGLCITDFLPKRQ